MMELDRVGDMLVLLVTAIGLLAMALGWIS